MPILIISTLGYHHSNYYFFTEVDGVPDDVPWVLHSGDDQHNNKTEDEHGVVFEDSTDSTAIDDAETEITEEYDETTIVDGIASSASTIPPENLTTLTFLPSTDDDLDKLTDPSQPVTTQKGVVF